MYQFTTQSGTAYTVRDGRITRMGEPILNDPDLAIVNERVRFPHGAPTVGQRCRIVLPDTTAGAITTSPVTTVERYCPTCDTFGDLFGCQADLAAVAAIAPLLARLSA